VRSTSDPSRVQTVGGNPYYANYAVRSFYCLVPIPFFVAFETGDLVHLFGAPLILVGAMAANARFSPVHGCLAWLPLTGLAIYSFSSPSVGIPLCLYLFVAWIAGSIECRLTLDPYESNMTQHETE